MAAGVGVAAYSAPIVSTVPAYAQAGLVSFYTQSSDICFGFSPNHQDDIGDWHIPASVAGVFAAGIYSNHANAPSTATITVGIVVGGISRTLVLGGNFNNWDGTTSGNYNVNGWNGGGIRFDLQDSRCEFLIIGWYTGTGSAAQNCNISVGAVSLMQSSFSPIDNGGVNPGTAPANNVPNPWVGGLGNRYYHSGKPRKGTGFISGIRFRIRCR